MLGLYSFSPLTPGGWSDLLSELGLPDTLRRLNQTVVFGGRRRAVEMRCLAALPGLAYLLTDRDGPSSASVRAWRLAARVVEGAVLGGGTVPDLSRFAAAFPEAGHAVVDVGDGLDGDEEPAALAPEAAVAGFVDSSMRALAAAVRDPKLLRSGEVQLSGVDLGVLQPLLRAVAPDLGMAAPVVRLRDSLAPLLLRLELPGGRRGRLAAAGDPGRSRPAAAGGARVRPARRGRSTASSPSATTAWSSCASPPRRSSSPAPGWSCRPRCPRSATSTSTTPGSSSPAARCSWTESSATT